MPRTTRRFVVCDLLQEKDEFCTKPRIHVLYIIQGASLASAPSVAFARFARSITGRDELARFSYCECGLRSLTHMGVMR